MKRVEFNVVSEWRCEAEYDDRNLLKRFIYYPCFVVHNFGAILKKTEINKADDLFLSSEQIPISVTINDNLILIERIV